jgi:hypothetical protein
MHTILVVFPPAILRMLVHDAARVLAACIMKVEPQIILFMSSAQSFISAS